MTLTCSQCGFKTEDPNMKDCPDCKVPMAEEVAPEESPEQQEMKAMSTEMGEIAKEEAEIESHDTPGPDEKAEMAKMEDEAVDIELQEEKLEEALGDAKPHDHAEINVKELCGDCNKETCECNNCEKCGKQECDCPTMSGSDGARGDGKTKGKSGSQQKSSAPQKEAPAKKPKESMGGGVTEL